MTQKKVFNSPQSETSARLYPKNFFNLTHSGASNPNGPKKIVNPTDSESFNPGKFELIPIRLIPEAEIEMNIYKVSNLTQSETFVSNKYELSFDSSRISNPNKF